MLRSWETRFGFPAPRRLDSGHRRYTDSDVASILQVVALRDHGLKLDAAIAEAARGAAPPAGRSVYAAIRRHDAGAGSHLLRKASLLALSWAIEDECCALAHQPHLFGAFQTEEIYLRSAPRWSDLARAAGSAMVFADFTGPGGPGEPVRVPLAPQSPMCREWAVVCDAPNLPAALAAWEIPGQSGTADSSRLFEAVWTFDPLTTREAARTCASVALEHEVVGAESLVEELSSAPAPAETLSPRLIADLLGRVVRYADRMLSGR